MMSKPLEVSLDGGKYQVFMNDDGTHFKAYRYGSAWQELNGNNLVYFMFRRILDAEDKIESAKLSWLTDESPTAGDKIKNIMDALCNPSGDFHISVADKLVSSEFYVKGLEDQLRQIRDYVVNAPMTTQDSEVILGIINDE